MAAEQYDQKSHAYIAINLVRKNGKKLTISKIVAYVIMHIYFLLQGVPNVFDSVLVLRHRTRYFSSSPDSALKRNQAADNEYANYTLLT